MTLVLCDLPDIIGNVDVETDSSAMHSGSHEESNGQYHGIGKAPGENDILQCLTGRDELQARYEAREHASSTIAPSGHRPLS